MRELEEEFSNGRDASLRRLLVKGSKELGQWLKKGHQTQEEL